MLSHLDAGASDALSTFTEAIEAAQCRLLKDEARLQEAKQLLELLESENEQLRQCKMQHTMLTQRLEALKAEKEKLSCSLLRKRQELQFTTEYMKQLQVPREKLEASLRSCEKEVQLLQQHYAFQAAPIHGRIAQLLSPQFSAASLQQAIAAAEVILSEEQLATAELKRQLLAQEQSLVELQQLPLDTTTSRARGANDGEKGESGEGCYSSGDAGTGESDGAAQLIELWKLQQEEHERLLSMQAAERAKLHGRREEVKSEVLRLCSAMEAADTAQQVEQKQLRDDLNDVDRSVGGGSEKWLCQGCRCDIIACFI